MCWYFSPHATRRVLPKLSQTSARSVACSAFPFLGSDFSHCSTRLPLIQPDFPNFFLFRMHLAHKRRKYTSPSSTFDSAGRDTQQFKFFVSPPERTLVRDKRILGIAKHLLDLGPPVCRATQGCAQGFRQRASRHRQCPDLPARIAAAIVLTWLLCMPARSPMP